MADTPIYTYVAPVASWFIPIILRSTDGAFIPCNLANSDYQGFLNWIAEGNPAPEGWTGPTND